jgi:HK97 family phage prohead protease
VTIAEIVNLRNNDGPLGDWARQIFARIEQRAAFIKGIDMEERAPDPALYGADTNSIGHFVMAADAALDAAQTLLMNYESDPIVSQAYYLICAADAALTQCIETLGLVDPDDDMNEIEPATMDMPAMNSADIELEERRAVIATAEKRNITAELRTETRADGMVAIRGYAAVFNREADGLPFREMIMPGAFTRSLDNGDECYLLINHNTDELPLARRNSGTLTLSEDANGLLMDAVLDPTNPRAAEVISVLTRGDASEMSFAFTISPDGQTRTKDGVRELRELNLFEVSICTWGAYSDTTVGLRTADAEADDLELRRQQLRLKLKQKNI